MLIHTMFEYDHAINNIIEYAHHSSTTPFPIPLETEDMHRNTQHIDMMALLIHAMVAFKYLLQLKPFPVKPLLQVQL